MIFDKVLGQALVGNSTCVLTPEKTLRGMWLFLALRSGMRFAPSAYPHIDVNKSEAGQRSNNPSWLEISRIGECTWKEET